LQARVVVEVALGLHRRCGKKKREINNNKKYLVTVFVVCRCKSPATVAGATLSHQPVNIQKWGLASSGRPQTSGMQDKILD
jgi:hypothetical protein